MLSVDEKSQIQALDREQPVLANDAGREVGATGGMLEAAALGAFMGFAGLVEDAQAGRALPAVPTRELAGLIYATAHGLIDLRAGGRMREQKGLTTPEESMALLLTLLREEQ